MTLKIYTEEEVEDLIVQLVTHDYDVILDSKDIDLIIFALQTFKEVNFASPEES